MTSHKVKERTRGFNTHRQWQFFHLPTPAPSLISCCGHSQDEICHCLKKRMLKNQEFELAEEFQGEKIQKH